ncbi:hypothetical protein JCM3766R1_003243 [Sporobolomyces carnicolor]
MRDPFSPLFLFDPPPTMERDDVDSTMCSPFAVEAFSTTPRPVARVGISSSSSCSASSVPPSVNENPLERPGFVRGLQCAGYLEPLDTSRNKVKQRFNHFLEKQRFKANLDAFLEHVEVERLGESMVRFVGTDQPHSPYVGVYVKSRIEPIPPVKIYAATTETEVDTTRSSSTEWTFVLADDKDEDTSEWACKAKRFWPVRVRFEGSSSNRAAAAADEVLPRARPRGKRRDTFRNEIDLDDELAKRERDEADQARRAAEAERLELNTVKNSARPRDSPAIEIDTKNTAPVAVEEEEEPDKRPAVTPTTPTVLESARQLGYSIVASLPPSMQQLPTVMQNRLKQWFEERKGGEGQEEEEVEEYWDSDEDRRRREKRRRRRERRKREEEEMEAERTARRQERRRRRAAGEQR